MSSHQRSAKYYGRGKKAREREKKGAQRASLRLHFRRNCAAFVIRRKERNQGGKITLEVFIENRQAIWLCFCICRVALCSAGPADPLPTSHIHRRAVHGASACLASIPASRIPPSTNSQVQAPPNRARQDTRTSEGRSETNANDELSVIRHQSRVHSLPGRGQGERGPFFSYFVLTLAVIILELTSRRSR